MRIQHIFLLLLAGKLLTFVEFGVSAEVGEVRDWKKLNAAYAKSSLGVSTPLALARSNNDPSLSPTRNYQLQSSTSAKKQKLDLHRF